MSKTHSTQTNLPPVLYHGTRVFFDFFEPLSQFAGKQVAELFLEKEPHESSLLFTQEENMRSIQKKLSQISENLFSVPKKSPAPKILIPVHIQMKNPYHLHHSEFHFTNALEGIVYRLSEDREKGSDLRKATPVSDFIFVHPMKMPNEKVCQELRMDNLFTPSENPKRNRIALSKQRFIQFLERSGYDGIVYDYTDHEHTEPAWVIFRNSQVTRLDKPHLKTPHFPTPQTKKTEKIATRYIRHHKERILSDTEYLARLDSYER